MKKDKYNLSKEELRKYNRKKAQQQAYALLIGAILVAVLVLGAAGFGIYKLFHREPVEEPVVVENTEPVIETPEITVEEIEQEPEPVEEEVETVSEDTVEEEPQELTEEQKLAALDAVIDTYIANMTLEQKVAGLFFVTPGQITNENNMTAAGSKMNEVLNNYPVGGILLDENNMESEAQLKDLIFNLKAFSSNNIFIGIQENGGSDSPFVTSGMTEAVISEPKEIGETKDNSGAYTSGIAIGTLLNRYGFNTVLGPVADIAYSESGYTSGDSFGSDPEEVRGMVRNAVHGELDQGLHVCVQYFPGYGDITSSPSGTRPVSSRTAEEIEKNEYPIYKDAISGGAEFIMVSQIAYKPITVDVPACLSSEVVTDMLRNDLEYDGIIMTDYMNTNSLIQHYKHADAAVMAIEAGCDMLVSPGNFQKAYNGILDAVNSGKITEERINESIRRIYRVKYKNAVNYDEIQQ